MFLRETSCVARSSKWSEGYVKYPKYNIHRKQLNIASLLLLLLESCVAHLEPVFERAFHNFSFHGASINGAKLANSKRLFHHSQVPLCLSAIKHHSRPIFGTPFSDGESLVSLRRFHRIGRRKSIIVKPSPVKKGIIRHRTEPNRTDSFRSTKRG